MPFLKLFLAPATLALAVAVPNLSFSTTAPLDSNTKKSERKYRTTIKGNGALTQKMIETCIILKGDIDQEYEKIDNSKKTFEALNEEIETLAAKIPKNKDDISVVEYNKQVSHYNNKLKELKKLAETHNKKSRPYQEKTARFKEECNNQPYYQDDYAAAVKKTGKSL